MLKISHLPRIMIRMKRKGKAAVGGAECTSGVFAGITKQNIRQGPTSGTMQASSPTDCLRFVSKIYVAPRGNTVI